MDYDEKMKLLVALKDNPNESSAIIDTFPSPKVPSEEPTRGELFGADWST